MSEHFSCLYPINVKSHSLSVCVNGKGHPTTGHEGTYKGSRRIALICL